MAKGQDMNEQQTDLDQIDEDILTYMVTDEDLEAAAGAGSVPELQMTGTYKSPSTGCGIYCC
jgi:hypothetical protein